MRNDLRYAVDLLQLLIRLLEQGIVLDRDDIAVTQRIRVKTRKSICIIQRFDKIIKRLLARDEGRGADIRDKVDL